MKKKLYRSMCAVACGTIFLTALVSLLVCYGLIETQIKETIRNECYLVAAGLNDTADEEAYFEELAKPLPETGRLSSPVWPASQRVFRPAPAPPAGPPGPAR